jgi:integrase
LAGWLDTRDRKKTPEFLTEQEVEQLSRKCRTAEQQYLVAVLFDSGARAEEFINTRFEDIQLPEGKENFVKLTLRKEFSKIKGRTISLYWRRNVESVSEYLKERNAAHPRPNPTDPVFKSTYDAMRMYLGRLGRGVLKRRIYPHLFRHSSATYYATKLNRQELCYRSF